MPSQSGSEKEPAGIILPHNRTGSERKKQPIKTLSEHGQQFKKKVFSRFQGQVGVALEALKEQMTLPEIEKKFGVSQYMISRWKSELSKNASQTFGASGKEKSHWKEIDNLHRKIGELEMMPEFAKMSSSC